MENKKSNLKFEAGEIIVFTSGAYSDFVLSGFLVSLKKLDLEKLLQEYAVGKSRWLFDENAVSYDGFMAWLVGKELAAPVNYRTVHLGEYDNWHDDFNLTFDSEDKYKVRA